MFKINLPPIVRICQVKSEHFVTLVDVRYSRREYFQYCLGKRVVNPARSNQSIQYNKFVQKLVGRRWFQYGGYKPGDGLLVVGIVADPTGMDFGLPEGFQHIVLNPAAIIVTPCIAHLSYGVSAEHSLVNQILFVTVRDILAVNNCFLVSV
jgi:hypothetical protein